MDELEETTEISGKEEKIFRSSSDINNKKKKK